MPSVSGPAYLPNLPAYLPTYLPAYLPTCLPTCLPTFLLPSCSLFPPSILPFSSLHPSLPPSLPSPHPPLYLLTTISLSQYPSSTHPALSLFSPPASLIPFPHVPSSRTARARPSAASASTSAAPFVAFRSARHFEPRTRRRSDLIRPSLCRTLSSFTHPAPASAAHPRLAPPKRLCLSLIAAQGPALFVPPIASIAHQQLHAPFLHQQTPSHLPHPPQAPQA